MMGNRIHSVMNPVPTLEDEEGDGVGTGFITECVWFPHHLPLLLPV
jgi:hypothetical protein